MTATLEWQLQVRSAGNCRVCCWLSLLPWRTMFFFDARARLVRLPFGPCAPLPAIGCSLGGRGTGGADACPRDRKGGPLSWIPARAFLTGGLQRKNTTLARIASSSSTPSPSPPSPSPPSPSPRHRHPVIVTPSPRHSNPATRSPRRPVVIVHRRQSPPPPAKCLPSPPPQLPQLPVLSKQALPS